MDLKSVGGVDRIDIAQDRERWQVVVNTVMNTGFHKMWGNSCPASQEGLAARSLLVFFILS